MLYICVNTGENYLYQWVGKCVIILIGRYASMTVEKLQDNYDTPSNILQNTLVIFICIPQLLITKKLQKHLCICESKYGIFN